MSRRNAPASAGALDHPPVGYDGPATGSLPGSGPPHPTDPKRRRRRRAKRIALITVLVLAALAGGAFVAGGLYLRSLESGIERIDAFQEVPEASRPQRAAEAAEAKNFLILGSDSRDPDVSGSRTDTIILAHLPADRAGMQLISIPRDTWVEVPGSADGRRGSREAKINAAFAWGGVPLMVRTVESFTKVRVDHVVVIDFAGFKEIIDALGGVDIEVDQSFTSIHDQHRQFTKGMMHMDGAAALDYARDRTQFKDGDFTRIRHQQQLIKAVLDKSAKAGLLTNPARLNAFVKASADAVTVDETLSLIDTATQLRHLRAGNLGFFTSPTKGTGRIGSESVVLADPAGVKALYEAVRRDKPREIAAIAK